MSNSNNTSIDLNIIDRNVPQNSKGWVSSKEYGIKADDSDFDEIIEQKTDNSCALNSIPTPFARFFVASEAFRRVRAEMLDSNKEAGLAYKQIVSDILDVYELLFNLKYHRNTWKNGETLEIREWDSQESLDKLVREVPVLGKSLKDYYGTDINESKLYFVVYRANGVEMLLACSSPLTGFVTPPDMDRIKVLKDNKTEIRYADQYRTDKDTESKYENLRIRKKSEPGYYFDKEKYKLLDQRDEEFCNYMIDLFGSDNGDEEQDEDKSDDNKQGKRVLKNIRRYISEFRKSTKKDANKLTDVLTDQNNSLVISGLRLKYCDDIDVNDYFTESIIKLPYRIDRELFKSVEYDKEPVDRDYDYLLPFKPKIMDLYNANEIKSSIHIGGTYVEVTIEYKKKKYSKKYTGNPLTPEDGKIFDMEGCHTNFDFGVFPNILSSIATENNYFKVIVVAADETEDSPIINIDRVSLNFFKNVGGKFTQIRELDQSSPGVQYGVRKSENRSNPKLSDHESGTKFYELFDTDFNAVEINIMGDTGLLFIELEKSKASNDAYTYAVDLGTSNTIMSCCKNDDHGNPDLSNRPELFRLERPVVSYLHEKLKDDQLTLCSRIEDSIFKKAKDKIKTEFVPAIIDGNDYKFPIRTALYGKKYCNTKIRLFDDQNIAFFYEKMMASKDQDIQTNIKWEEKDEMLEIFVRELLLIIKCDVLQKGGDLNKTKLVWFYPLSFMGNKLNTYKDIWETMPKEVLKLDVSQIKGYTESEAPYYYYKLDDRIKVSSSVSVIDIGGGSTDFIYFADNEFQMANSVHFGCDVLWENGFNKYETTQENGIYKYFKDNSILKFENQELSKLNDDFRSKGAKTKDAISFWLTNSESSDFRKKLKLKYQPLFVYHLTSILFYMASMYKDNDKKAPRMIVFSGNGSRYIDELITDNKSILCEVINLIFSYVFGGKHDVLLELPKDRKESTCYGGLYRKANAPDVTPMYYQGEVSQKYETVGDVTKNLSDLKDVLASKYKQLNELYGQIIGLLRNKNVIESDETKKYVDKAKEDMMTPFDTYYSSEIKQKYVDDSTLMRDSVFFLPIIDRIFNLTKI